MIKKLITLLSFVSVMSSSALFAETSSEGLNTAAPKDKVRYTKSKKLDFSSQTVEGKLQRPETSLITASESLSTNGILRLREDFLDKYASDAGEPVK